jgi:hypothetical protein
MNKYDPNRTQATLLIDGKRTSVALNRQRGPWAWVYAYINGKPTTEHSIPLDFWHSGKGRITTGGHTYEFARD